MTETTKTPAEIAAKLSHAQRALLSDFDYSDWLVLATRPRTLLRLGLVSEDWTVNMTARHYGRPYSVTPAGRRVRALLG